MILIDSFPEKPYYLGKRFWVTFTHNVALRRAVSGGKHGILFCLFCHNLGINSNLFL